MKDKHVGGQVDAREMGECGQKHRQAQFSRTRVGSEATENIYAQSDFENYIALLVMVIIISDVFLQLYSMIST